MVNTYFLNHNDWKLLCFYLNHKIINSTCTVSSNHTLSQCHLKMLQKFSAQLGLLFQQIYQIKFTFRQSTINAYVPLCQLWGVIRRGRCLHHSCSLVKKKTIPKNILFYIHVLSVFGAKKLWGIYKKAIWYYVLCM